MLDLSAAVGGRGGTPPAKAGAANPGLGAAPGCTAVLPKPSAASSKAVGVCDKCGKSPCAEDHNDMLHELP